MGQHTNRHAYWSGFSTWLAHLCMASPFTSSSQARLLIPKVHQLTHLHPVHHYSVAWTLCLQSSLSATWEPTPPVHPPRPGPLALHQGSLTHVLLYAVSCLGSECLNTVHELLLVPHQADPHVEEVADCQMPHLWTEQSNCQFVIKNWLFTETLSLFFWLIVVLVCLVSQSVRQWIDQSIRCLIEGCADLFGQLGNQSINNSTNQLLEWWLCWFIWSVNQTINW